MAFFQKILDDKIVGTVANSSPGTGWTSVANFPAMITNARTACLPLYLLPGIYSSGQIDVTTSTGGGNPITLTAALGTVTIQLSASAQYLFKATDVNNIIISNITFDGNNMTLTESTTFPGVVRFSGVNGINNFVIDNCTITHSKGSGISTDNATGRICNNSIYGCDNGICGLDSRLQIERNSVNYCNDNGIQIWTSSVNGNSSTVSNNYITNISHNSGGTGQYGNGIVLYRAQNVRVINNVIGITDFSSIRLNQAGNCHVMGNFCFSAREVALFIECPGPGSSGTYLVGGVVANNIINGAGGGIAVVNSGLAGDGVTRRITVIGNQISNITRTYISDYSNYTFGIGILCEGGCNIVGNSIESTDIAGIMLGTNNASTDLLASGNFVRNTNIGIGYSADPSAVGTLISGNLISGYTTSSNVTDPNYAHSGAIVSASYIAGTANTYQRDSSTGVPNTDYGNATQTVAGPLTVGNNKSHL